MAFLIDDYGKATSLLYDVVLSPSFRPNPRYFDGLFYLGEALRQQKDYLGAKHFLRELLEAGPNTPHFDEALVSYLDVAARTNDFRDIDRYAELAEHSGRIAPAVQYLLAKATFERTDLAEDERIAQLAGRFRAGAAAEPVLSARPYFSASAGSSRAVSPRPCGLFVRVASLPQGDAAQNRDPRAGLPGHRSHRLRARAVLGGPGRLPEHPGELARPSTTRSTRLPGPT